MRCTKGCPHKKTSLDQEGQSTGHQPGHPEPIQISGFGTDHFVLYIQRSNK